jgi:hypothetical protein
MLNEAEKSNVPAAIFKFLAWTFILIGVGSFMFHFVHGLQTELNRLSERLVHLICSSQ